MHQSCQGKQTGSIMSVAPTTQPDQFQDWIISTFFFFLFFFFIKKTKVRSVDSGGPKSKTCHGRQDCEWYENSMAVLSCLFAAIFKNSLPLALVIMAFQMCSIPALIYQHKNSPLQTVFWLEIASFTFRCLFWLCGCVCVCVFHHAFDE